MDIFFRKITPYQREKGKNNHNKPGCVPKFFYINPPPRCIPRPAPFNVLPCVPVPRRLCVKKPVRSPNALYSALPSVPVPRRLCVKSRCVPRMHSTVLFSASLFPGVSALKSQCVPRMHSTVLFSASLFPGVSALKSRCVPRPAPFNALPSVPVPRRLCVRKAVSIVPALIFHHLHHPAHAAQAGAGRQRAGRGHRQPAALAGFVEVVQDAGPDLVRDCHCAAGRGAGDRRSWRRASSAG
jgi:hypothetical protein